MGQSSSSPSSLLESSKSLILRRGGSQPQSRALSSLLSNPIILHLILTFTPPTSSTPLLVSSLWYQTFIPILYHTPVLRSQPDIHNLFYSLPSSRHPTLKSEALFHVKKLVLLVGETPPASPSVESGELGRWRNAEAAGDTTNWLPRLEELQLGWGREGLRDVGAGLVSMVNGRGHSLAGEIGRLFRVIKPRSVVFQPTAWGCIEGQLEGGGGTTTPTETHALLHPATLSRLQTLLEPLFTFSSSPPTSLTYSHLFLHELFLHQPRTPRPTFLLPPPPSPSSSSSEPFTLKLSFAPLSSLPTEGDQGLSLNPWDRRVSLAREACLAVGPEGRVLIKGVSERLREELRSEATRGAELEGRLGELGFEDEPGSVEGRKQEEEKREVPDLTPTQLHALFYTTPIGQPGGGGFWPNSTTLAIPVVLQAPA